jgi:hypothetical protein
MSDTRNLDGKLDRQISSWTHVDRWKNLTMCESRNPELFEEEIKPSIVEDAWRELSISLTHRARRSKGILFELAMCEVVI